jgi:hypothetical protein
MPLAVKRFHGPTMGSVALTPGRSSTTTISRMSAGLSMDRYRLRTSTPLNRPLFSMRAAISASSASLAGRPTTSPISASTDSFGVV